MRSERGYVGTRVLVGLGFVSLLVWLVPMVFLSSKQAEIITSVAAPASGSGPGEAAGPADPIGKANDVQAQSLLSGAIQVAQVWYAENGSYAGFGPQQAAQYEPSVSFTTGAPSAGAVVMRVTPDAVVMVTLTSRGDPLCSAVSAGVVSTGRADATTPQQCQGGW